MTAYEINPKLFVVIRKNKRHNSALFTQFNADITMQPTDIIAHECLAHMISPLLAQFLTLIRNQPNEWSNKLISQLVEKVGENVPETWALTIDKHHAPAVDELLQKGLSVTLENLTQDPANRVDFLDIVPLMLSRNNEQTLIPTLSTKLLAGDQILFCGRPEAKSVLPLLLNNAKTLTYMIDGIQIPDSAIWRWARSFLVN